MHAGCWMSVHIISRIINYLIRTNDNPNNCKNTMQQSPVCMIVFLLSSIKESSVSKGNHIGLCKINGQLRKKSSASDH